MDQTVLRPGLNSFTAPPGEPPVFCFPSESVPLLPEDSESIDPSDFRIEERWGRAHRALQDLDDFTPGRRVSSVLRYPGAWGVHASDARGRHLFLTDSFGMDTVFYAPVWAPGGGRLLVGRTAADLASAAMAMGGVMKTDWVHVLPSLSEKYPLFANCYESFTPLRAMRLLRGDQALLVTGNGYRVCKRPQAEVMSSSLEGLVHSGVSSAVNQLRGYGAEAETIEVRLSGGKDSRLVLAMALEAGLGSKLRIATADPSKASSEWQRNVLENDQRIAARLVERFQLQWQQESPSSRAWPTTLMGAIHQWLQYRGGTSYVFSCRPGMYRMVEPHYSLNGTGGETYRSYWLPSFQRRPVWATVDGTPDAIARDARILFTDVRRGLSLPGEVAGRAAQRFGQEVAMLPGARDLASAFIQHYLHFRNRGHAGSIRQANSHNAYPFAPLMQPEFVAASTLLDSDMASAGQVGHDALELLDPTLNDLEFESGPWTCRVPERERMDWSGYPGVMPPPVRPGRHTTRWAASAPQDPAAMLDAALAELAEAMTQDGLDPALIDPLRSQKRNAAETGQMLIKLAHWANCVPTLGSHLAQARSAVSPRVEFPDVSPA